MKLQIFYILLLYWLCDFAQIVFGQDHNVESFENNVELSPDGKEQNPSEVVAELDDDENIHVETDSVETIAQNVNDNTNDNNVGYNPVKGEQERLEAVEKNGNTDEHVVRTDATEHIEDVDSNVIYRHVETGENLNDGLAEDELYNGEHDVETDSPEIQGQIELRQNSNAKSIENSISYNQVETQEHSNEVVPVDNEHDIGTHPVESLAQNEFENDVNTETFENNIVNTPFEIEQNPVEMDRKSAEDINGHDSGTRAAEMLTQDGLEQKDNAENVKDNVVHNSFETEEHIIEVVPKREVDTNEHDVGNDPRKIHLDFQQDHNGEAMETNIIHATDDAHDEHVGTDFVEILGLPGTISSPNLRSTIRYSVAGPRILIVEIFTVGVDHIKSIFHTEWTEALHYAGVIKTKILRVTLPDNLVYKEDKILQISPDLHSETLLARACIVDFKNPSEGLCTEYSIKLTPPWSRLSKYSRHECSSWIGMFFKNLTRNRVPKCPKIDDVVELLSFPVALVGNEYGYKNFFQNLRVPDELLNRPPQFTLATWLYLTKRCSKDMCPLLYHIKGTAFQTPLIGLLKTGHLHLQFHYEDGSGYAFLVDAQIPVHKWVHIAVTIKHTEVSVYVRYGKRLQHVKTFVHSDFPAGLYHYNDTDGYWGLGGSPGFISTHGFIGPARIYRRNVLSRAEIETVFTAASRPNLGVLDHFKSCRNLKSAVKILLRKKSEASRHCSSRDWLNDAKSSYCSVGARGLATEIVRILVETLNINETGSTDMIRQKVYEHAFNLTKTNRNNVKDALLLLSYSSCLGHQQSLYLISVLHRTGLGVTANPKISQRYLLLGSYNNHPLSQMSLAYKHYIGVDGFPKDPEVASTYYRYAAVQSNRLLVEHNEVDTHSEAVRLDKKEDLDNYRGPDSNWFSWLKHQAKRGVTDAQSALGEVFYYGSRGFRRNLTKAAEFYEMGANRGDAQMLFNLGVVKLRGQGVSVNSEEARELLKKSAELGFAPAYNALGYYELNVRQNKSGAVEYFRFAAEHEDRDGLYNLGFALENGLTPGTVGDLKSAMPYYISAANKGHTGACVVAGDAFCLGQYVERDVKISVIFYKFVADQIPEIGLHLRNGLDEYFEKAWYQSLLYYLLAAEAGMEMAQYNAALLCEWDWERVSQHTQVDCAWRYYNHSAKLEWVPSLLKTGDNHWYGITTEKNITAAAKLYSQAATKEQNPQAIYNLGYLVENNYPLDGLDWMHFHFPIITPGNLSLAASLYRKCRDTSDEALLPCSLGLVRVAMKRAWQLDLVKSEILLIPLTLFTVSLALLYYLCRLNSDHQLIDLA